MQATVYNDVQQLIDLHLSYIDGVVYHFGKPLTPCQFKNGYVYYRFQENKQKFTIRAHRLVALFTYGHIPEGYEIDHIDRNKANNTPDNLRIVSSQENQQNKSSYIEGYDPTLKPGTLEYKRQYHRLYMRNYRKKLAQEDSRTTS